MIIVGKHINGITLNPLEYLLDDDGDPQGFNDEDEAKRFLKAEGFTDDDMYFMVFEEINVEKRILFLRRKHR